MTDFLKANRELLRFQALFVLIFAGCYLLFGVIPRVRFGVINPYTEFLAKAVTAVINLFGAAAVADGALVYSPRYSIDIAMGCDGVEASCLYLAGVVAFPTSWRSRLIGLALGVPLIQAINLARIVVLYYIGMYLPSVAVESMTTLPRPSSSFSQRPSSSSGSSDLPFGISGHKWLRLFALALALYIVILPLWWYSLSAISAVAGTCASWIYTFFDARVAIKPRARVVQLVVDGRLQPSGLRIDMVTYGLPMLIALVIMTRSNSLVAKLQALAIGCAVMFGLTVCAVLAWAKMANLQLEQQASPGSDQSSFFFLAFHGYTFSQPVVAVLIWLMLVMLGLFKGISKHERGVGAVARNASCPCGSGRKYKRCCGE